MHVGFGGNPRRVGNLEGRVQGANGGQRELVYEQPGTEVDIPITTVGCQVSRKENSKGDS